MCKCREAFSLAVLIDRGLDQETGLITVMEWLRGVAYRTIPESLVWFFPSRYPFIQFSGYRKVNNLYVNLLY